MSKETDPKNICCLRLSSIGDCISALAVVQMIARQRPDDRIAWLIGKAESALMKGIPGIEFIPFSKKDGLKAYLEARKALKDRKFDCLLDMQSSLKASFLSLLVRAPVKYGFDAERAMDMQQLFTTVKVPSPESPHVIDGFMAFAEAIGCKAEKPTWNFYLKDREYELARKYGIDKRTVVLSPCSSKDYKNWSNIGYIEICRHAALRGFKIALCSGRSSKELALVQIIEDGLASIRNSVINISGKTSLREMLAVIDSSALVISPDSAAVHMANALNVPVVGIYANHDPKRVGPVNFMKYAVSIYDEEIKKERGDVSSLKWRTRVRNKRAMLSITSQQVKSALDRIIEDFHLQQE